MDIIENIKNLFNSNSDDYDQEYEMEDEGYYEPEEKVIPVKRREFVREEVDHKEEVEIPIRRDRKVQQMPRKARRATVAVINPKEKKDVTLIIDALVDGKIVLVNMKDARYSEAQQSIIDSISGAIYVKEARLERITDLIYLIIPSSIGFEAEEEYSRELGNETERPLSSFPSPN